MHRFTRVRRTLKRPEVRAPVGMSRSSLCWKVRFHKSYSQGLGEQFEHVRTMFLDLYKVLFSVVSGSGANHRANDLQPTMSQTAQSTSVALSFVSVGPIKRRSPGAGMSAEVGPQMQSGPQPVNARSSDLHTFDLATL